MSHTIPIRSDKEEKVEALFRLHFEALCGLAAKYIKDFDDSKDIVHEVFTSFWQKFDSLPADTNYKSYLFTSVRNKSFNYLRDNKKHLNIIEAEFHVSGPGSESLESKELAREIDFALKLLPERCREVFELSRYENLKYSQIAEQLNISVKTVEGQMSKALRLLRVQLRGFLIIIIILFGIG